MRSPRYPEIRVDVRSPHPLALIGAVRLGLRRAGVPHREIALFSEEAFGSGDPGGVLATCRRWVELDAPIPPRPRRLA